MKSSYIAFAVLALCAVSASAGGNFTFDADLNELLVRVADMAYCCESNLQKWNCGPICEQLSSIVQFENHYEQGGSGDMVAYVTARSDTLKYIFVTFRGTNTIWQLILEGLGEKNVGYDLHDIEKACVQAVFFERYNRIRDALLAEVKSLIAEYPDYKVVVTGHSLGGALATHASLDFVLNGLVSSENVICYPYASPRVGNFAFAQKHKELVPNTFRIVHYNDIFVTWPVSCDKNDDGDCITGVDDSDYGTPGGKFFGWHVDTEVFYNKEMTSYQICDSESQQCADQWHSIFRRSIGAHLKYMGVGMGCGTQQIPTLGVDGVKQSECVYLPIIPLMDMHMFEEDSN